MERVEKPHWGRWIRLRSRLVGFGFQKDLAAAVGCTEDHLSRWGHQENPPRMRKGYDAKLAKALETTREMLLNGWQTVSAEDAPRVKSEPVFDLTKVDDYSLMREVCARQRPFLVELLNAIDIAEKADWQRVLDSSASWAPGLPLPSEMQQYLKTLMNLSNIDRFIERFDPLVMARCWHSILPGSDRPSTSFNRDDIQKRRKRLGDLAGYAEVLKKFDEFQKWSNDQLGFELQRIAESRKRQKSRTEKSER